MQNIDDKIFEILSANDVEKSDKFRAGMERIWKETFHDTDEYISLLFDCYYTGSEKGCVNEHGMVISSMLGIPCRFKIDGGKICCGLYLCGLATAPEYRGEGLMGELIRRMAAHAEEAGYDFLFLIPASEGLRGYYRMFGFENAFPKRRWNFRGTKANGQLREDEKGKKDERNRYALRIEYFKTAESLLENIGKSRKHGSVSFSTVFNELEEKEGGTSKVCRILKNEKDLLAAVRECYLSDGRIYISTDENSGITGIAFIYIKEGIVEVYKIISDNEITKLAILAEIKKDFPNCRLEILDRLDNRISEGAVYHSGMMKIVTNRLSEAEISKISGADIYLMLD